MFGQKRSKKKFTPDEDRKLKLYVNLYGTNNWGNIAAAFGERTARQLKERWFNYLDPNIDLNEWTAEEDDYLLEKVTEIGRKWRTISHIFKGRTDVHLKNRYNLVIRRERNPGEVLNLTLQKNIEKITYEPTYCNELLDLLTILPNDFNTDFVYYDDSL